MNSMFRKLKELTKHQCHFCKLCKTSKHGFNFLQAQHAQESLPWLCTLVSPPPRTLTDKTWLGSPRKSFCWSNFLGGVKVRGEAN